MQKGGGRCMWVAISNIRTALQETQQRDTCQGAALEKKGVLCFVLKLHSYHHTK